MPKKNYKKEIMRSLRMYHNPFRLTEAEIERAGELLDQIEAGGAQWMDSLQELANLLEIVPLEMHEGLYEYNDAVARDAARLHKPVQVYPNAPRDEVMEAFSDELVFQRKHAMYRYLMDQLRKCEDEQEVRNHLLAFWDMGERSDRSDVRESVEAILGDYERKGALPKESITRQELEKTEAKLIRDFERPGWLLGYSIRDTERIADGLNEFKSKKWGLRLKSPIQDEHAVNMAVRNIRRLDGQFKNNLQAMMALKSKNANSSYNKLLDLVLADLKLDKNPKEYSVKEMLKQNEMKDLEVLRDGLIDAYDAIETHWVDPTSKKDAERYNCALAFARTLREMEGYLNALNFRQLNHFALTENGNVDFSLMVVGEDGEEEPLDIYRNALNRWHERKLKRMGLEAESQLEEDSGSVSSEEEGEEEEKEEEISTSSKSEEKAEDITTSSKSEEKAEDITTSSKPEEKAEDITTSSKPEEKAEDISTSSQPKAEEKAVPVKPVPAVNPAPQGTQVKPTAVTAAVPKAQRKKATELVDGEYYPDYDLFVEAKGAEGRKQINSNDPNVLIDMLNTMQDPLGKKYLLHRVNEVRKIQNLTQHPEPHRAPMVVLPPNDGSIVLDTKQKEKQSTGYGCWSVSLATQLQYRGVDLNQRTIRAFRPDTEDFSQNEVFRANLDISNSIENYTELVQSVLPDTAVNNLTTEIMNSADEAEKYLRASVDRALRQDNSPLSITCNGHYRTIYGILKDPNGDAAKDRLLFHDPLDAENHSLTVKEFVDLCDINRWKRKEDYKKDPNYKYQYQFAAAWMQDLHINEQGELGGALQAQGISYQDGLLQHTGESMADANTYKTFNTGRLVPELPLSVVTYLPKKSFARLQLEHEQMQQAAQQEQPVQQEQPAQQLPFNENAAQEYMRSLRKQADILQKSFDALTDTNTDKMWKKSSEEYQVMYKTFGAVKGNEKGFYDALCKKTPEEITTDMKRLFSVTREYERAKAKRLNRGSDVGEQRLNASQSAMFAMADIVKSAKTVSASCEGRLVPEFLEELQASGRKKIDVSDLQRKVEKDNKLPKLKESRAGDWINIELADSEKNAGTKTANKVKTL